MKVFRPGVLEFSRERICCILILCIAMAAFQKVQSPFVKGVIDFKITTPLFFARLARYSHISEFLSNEILTDDDKDRTFYTSHPRVLLQLFKDSSNIPRPSSEHSPLSNGLRWRFLQWLRTNRSQKAVQSDVNKQQHTKSDIRHLSFSELDSFAMSLESPSGKAQYVGATTKILLSDIVAFGYPEILDAVNYVLKVLASYVVVYGMKDIWYMITGELERLEGGRR